MGGFVLMQRRSNTEVKANKEWGMKKKSNEIERWGSERETARARISRREKGKVQRVWGLDSQEEEKCKFWLVLGGEHAELKLLGLTVSEMYKMSPSSKYSSSGWKNKTSQTNSRLGQPRWISNWIQSSPSGCVTFHLLSAARAYLFHSVYCQAEYKCWRTDLSFNECFAVHLKGFFSSN